MLTDRVKVPHREGRTHGDIDAGKGTLLVGDRVLLVAYLLESSN